MAEPITPTISEVDVELMLLGVELDELLFEVALAFCDDRSDAPELRDDANQLRRSPSSKLLSGKPTSPRLLPDWNPAETR